METLGKKEHIDFYMIVRNHFVSVCNYIVSKFPLRSEVLHHSEVTDISKQEMATWESITFFVKKFPILVNQREDESMHVAIDKLQEEFNENQAFYIPENILKAEREDIRWFLMSEIKNSICQPVFQTLSHFMLGILTIQHSNAGCERIFSQVRKTRLSLEDLCPVKH